MSVGFNLSLSDLLLVHGFAQAFGEDNKEAINKFLEQNGMDTSQEIDEVVCKHRNLRGQVVDCLMYQGHELETKAWLASGAASWDCVVDNCDLDLRIALKTMGKSYNNSGHIISELERHSN
jgi:hypothetical protein